MKKYNRGYQYQEDMDDRYDDAKLTSPDPDDASWNPGNLDTHNADEEALRDEEALTSDSYSEDELNWGADDYDEEDDL